MDQISETFLTFQQFWLVIFKKHDRILPPGVYNVELITSK